MMLLLNDGRAELWQWDTGRTLAVDADCSQVHFSNKVFGRSIDVDVIDGVAIIPDILLQTDKDLSVWAFVGTAENGYTKISKTFAVNRRNKPADYVFTQTDQMTLQTIQSQIGDLTDLTTEAKDTLVDAINEAARTGGGGGGSTVELDTTLTKSGQAADAAAVGNRLSSLSEEISNLGGGTGGCYLTVETITIGDDSGEPENVPVTGLSLDLTTYSANVGDGFYINPVITPSNATNKAVTWKTDKTGIATVNSSGYVECIAEGSAVITCTTVDGGFTATCSVSVADESSGEPEVTLSSISATYSGGDVAVGTAVTDLTGIVVTAHYSDGSTATVTDYTLSGTIAEGSNTIAVSYGGKTTTFTVTGIEENTGGGTAGQKIQFSTLEINSGMMGPAGSIVHLGSTYHVQLPYSDGMQISTGSNPSWDKSKFPPIVVYDNGTYNLPETTDVGSSTSVGGKYSTQMLATLTGYTGNAVVYASFLAGGTLGSTLETNMDTADRFYYIPGGEA